jgi:DNA mismatch repair ATPase MutL
MNLSVLMSKSCKNAIKFNDELDDKTSLDLISQLKHCNHPLYCIHGRNSVYPLCEIRNAAGLLKVNLRNMKKVDVGKLRVFGE